MLPRFLCLALAVAAIPACDKFPSPGGSSAPQNSPPPVTQVPATAGSDAEEPPPSTRTPAAQAAPSAAPRPIEIAAALLPAAQPDLAPDVERGEIVVRLRECYTTAAGVTATFNLVHTGEQHRVISIEPGHLRNVSPYPPTMLVIDGRVHAVGALPPITLPPRTPFELQVLWTCERSVIGSIDSLALNLEALDPAVFVRLPVASPPSMLPGPERTEAALRLLEASCSEAVSGLAHWQIQGKRDFVSVRFKELSAQGGAFSGEFFLPGDPRARKPFTGTLTSDPQAGETRATLKLVEKAGMPGRPTPEPSNHNLLLQGAKGTFALRLYGHELYGQSDNGAHLSITATPPAGP